MEKRKDYPAVSIIIPTCNREHCVGRAITSVLNQTYPRFELIVVDDGSIDDTEKVIKNFHDKRIVYLRHEKNLGAPAARNTGIKAARGDYIAFLDDDDEWLPEKLEKQMNLFVLSPDTGVVYSGFWKWENNRNVYVPYRWVSQKEGYIHEELLKGNFVGTPTAVVRKACFLKAGLFDEELPCLQDWELWIRISKHFPFMCVDEPLIRTHYTPGSISELSRGVRAKTLQMILEKHSEDFSENRTLLARYYSTIGHLLHESNDRTWRQYYIKAMKLNPMNLRVVTVVILSFFGYGLYDKAVYLYQKLKK
jgi:glycosyltransferase involved in cell wall biosynthesis